MKEIIIKNSQSQIRVNEESIEIVSSKIKVVTNQESGK